MSRSRLTPVSRREFVQRLLSLGFVGPFGGGKHEFLVRGTRRLILTNPHRGEIGAALLSRLLDQAGVTRDEGDGSN